MFTVLSNTRNSNLYLIAALAGMIVVVLTLASVPATSAPQPAVVPLTAISEAGSDYYQRHPELRQPGAMVVDTTGDFFLRHPDWVFDVQSVVVPVTSISEASDYFQRHPELKAPAEIEVDMSDYFIRHPELRTPNITIDLSDYFLRH